MLFHNQWLEFCWNLSKLPKDRPELTGRLRLRQGTDDPQRIWNILRRVYASDPSWGSGWNVRLEQIRKPVLEGIQGEPLSYFFLEDGKRIIGLSGLNPKTEPQLVTGICVIDEYRCRGYGSILLYESLKHLADTGAQNASVITRAMTNAAKYLYPKFGGVYRPVDQEKTSAKKTKHVQESLL